MRGWLLFLVFSLSVVSTYAQEQKPHPVPYRLTDTQHVLVRLKINGKGPFNFIMDTGCPVLLISTEAAKKAGLADDKGKAVIDRLDIEGGLAQTSVKARVETPFQIEGMNAMGLAGVELHGLLGYTVIAKYRLEFDFTRDRMMWTPLAFDPPPPQAVNVKGASTSLEMMAGLMKLVSFLSGMKPAPPPVPRGFLGAELTEKNNRVEVARIMQGTPAAKYELKAGDVVEQVEDQKVSSLKELRERISALTWGKEARLRIVRGTEKRDLKVVLSDGF